MSVHPVSCSCGNKNAVAWLVDNEPFNFQDSSNHPLIHAMLLESPLSTQQIEGFFKYVYQNERPVHLFLDFDGTVNVIEFVNILDLNLDTVFGTDRRQFVLKKLLELCLKKNCVFILTRNPAIEHISMLLNKLIGSKGFIPDLNVINTLLDTKMNYIELIMKSRGYQIVR